jgi:hypothetical protein
VKYPLPFTLFRRFSNLTVPENAAPLDGIIDSQPHTAWLNRILREKKYGAFNPGPDLIKMVLIRNIVTTGVHLHCEPAAEGEDYSDTAPPPPPPLGPVPQPEVHIFYLLVVGLHSVFVITQVLGFLTTAVAREGVER